MNQMNICIIGSGGRESALAWKLSQSPRCTKLFILPGNGGSLEYGINVEFDINDQKKLVDFILNEKIRMLIIGPEAPLVDGMTDALNKVDSIQDLMIIGPSKMGAMLEGSKAFAKSFMQEFNIPTAAYGKFNNDELESANSFLDNQKPPFVLKADGLAAGKGVLIINDLQEAKAELKDMLAGKFGDASKTIIIEEFLDGIEFSVFVLTDGKNYKILPEAKDYKRIKEGDKGLNTGGMGAVSPVSFVDSALMKEVEEKIIRPTIDGLQSRKMDYKGFIFLGLILVNGAPYVIEYNCRLGDPETEVIIPRLENDLVDLLESVHNDNLQNQKIIQNPKTAVTVMLVSNGYPGAYEKGKKINGLEQIDDSLIFHAGTRKQDLDLLTNGGRVIAVTSLESDMQQAVDRCMANIEKIHFEGKQFRTDIGFDL